MNIIPSTAPKSLTSDTTVSNYLLIVDAYSKIPKLYGMENITTEEVMEKLDMFQSGFGTIDQFGWWDLERISADAGTQFTSTEFKYVCQTCGVWHSSLNSVEVKCVPASAEIISKSHHPNWPIFLNLDWNISNLSITSSVVILSIP